MHIHEIGELIRKIRKQRGLRLEDLADENISPATISNIERGVPHVNMDKAEYLLAKLGLDLSDLPDLIVGDQQKLQHFQFELFSAESLQDMGKVDLALKKLDQLQYDDQHPLAATVYYLKGKCLNSKKKWKRAEKTLQNAIRLSKAHPESNITAASFCELGITRYEQNDLHQALKDTESGIAAFQEDGERPQFRYVLQKNKAIYLERLGRLAESLKVVQEMWDDLDRINKIDVLTGFYWLHSELLRRTGLPDEAIRYAEEGLELARINNQYDNMYDLWIVLGSIHMNQNNWMMAEKCFTMALHLEGLVSNGKVFTTTYARLSILHMHREEWETAEKMILKAVKNSEIHNDIPRLTYALLVNGDFHRAQNHNEEAVQLYQKALDLARKHHYKKQEHQALFRLAQSWEDVDEQKFQKCMTDLYHVQKELQHEDEESNFSDILI